MSSPFGKYDFPKRLKKITVYVSYIHRKNIPLLLAKVPTQPLADFNHGLPTFLAPSQIDFGRQDRAIARTACGADHPLLPVQASSKMSSDRNGAESICYLFICTYTYIYTTWS